MVNSHSVAEDMSSALKYKANRTDCVLFHSEVRKKGKFMDSLRLERKILSSNI